MKVMCETEEEYFLQHLVHQKLQGYNMPHPKCKATVLIELASELRSLKEEHSSKQGILLILYNIQDSVWVELIFFRSVQI